MPSNHLTMSSNARNFLSKVVDSEWDAAHSSRIMLLSIYFRDTHPVSIAANIVEDSSMIRTRIESSSPPLPIARAEAVDPVLNGIGVSGV